MEKFDENTVIVVGAGPIGIAAAAHLLDRGLNPIVLEKGANAGHAMNQWGHVRVFTPWQYIYDKAVLGLLAESKWSKPQDDEYLPLGREIVHQYLVPAATQTQVKNHIIYGATVIAITKKDKSKLTSEGREASPFAVKYSNKDGKEVTIEANSVIDASGTWYSPNPMGWDGMPVAGEIANKESIFYGIPDSLHRDHKRYAGKSTLVIGGGHSAINSVLDLIKLKEQEQETKIFWGLKQNHMEKLVQGGINDELPARGQLGVAAEKAIENGFLDILAPLKVDSIEKSGSQMKVRAHVNGEEKELFVDQIIVTAWFKPDLEITKELRLDLDTIVEAPSKLAPLIDPNLHSCGTVRPHGVRELTHYDDKFYIVGMKSYGRAPTFLMLTGYEQVIMAN